MLVFGPVDGASRAVFPEVNPFPQPIIIIFTGAKLASAKNPIGDCLIAAMITKYGALVVEGGHDAVGSFAIFGGARSEQVVLCGETLEAERLVGFGGEDAALRGALQVTFLNEKRFVDFLQRVRFLANGDGDSAEPDRTAFVIF